MQNSLYIIYNTAHKKSYLLTSDWSNAPDPGRDNVSAGTFILPALNWNSTSNWARAKLHLMSLLDFGADSVRYVRGLWSLWMITFDPKKTVFEFSHSNEYSIGFLLYGSPISLCGCQFTTEKENKILSPSHPCNEVHLNYVKCIIVYTYITLALYRLD